LGIELALPNAERVLQPAITLILALKPQRRGDGPAAARLVLAPRKPARIDAHARALICFNYGDRVHRADELPRPLEERPSKLAGDRGSRNAAVAASDQLALAILGERLHPRAVDQLPSNRCSSLVSRPRLAQKRLAHPALVRLSADARFGAKDAAGQG